jgi:hypothetical protein
MNLRACTILPNRVPDNAIKGALFHKWIDLPYEQKETYPFMGTQNIVVEKSTIMTKTMALVELPNGWCQVVEIERVQFTDNDSKERTANTAIRDKFGK